MFEFLLLNPGNVADEIHYYKEPSEISVTNPTIYKEDLKHYYQTLKKFRKFAIVIAFLSAAFLTPPDPFSQLSLALPIILLYEISIFIAKIIQKNDNKK